MDVLLENSPTEQPEEEEVKVQESPEVPGFIELAATEQSTVIQPRKIKKKQKKMLLVEQQQQELKELVIKKKTDA